MKRISDSDLRKPWISYTVAICAGVILFVLLTNLKPIFASFQQVYRYIRPVFLGLILAYVLNPLVKLVHRHIFRKYDADRTAWTASVAIVVILALGLLTLLLVMLIPQLISSSVRVLENVDKYSSILSKMLGDIEGNASEHNVDISQAVQFVQGLLNRAISYLSGHAPQIINTITNMGTGIVTGTLTCFVAIYFLSDKYRLTNGLNHLLVLAIPPKRYNGASTFWKRCHYILVRFIVYDLLDGLIIGIVNAVFMMILQMPYVILVSVVVGVTNLLPTFGPIIGGAIGAIILMLANPMHALGFLIFTFVLQTIDGYILKPKMFGGALDVPSIWILVMIIIGGRTFGIAGILLAIPMAAILCFLYSDYLVVKLEERRAALTAEEEGAAGQAEANDLDYGFDNVKSKTEKSTKQHKAASNK